LGRVELNSNIDRKTPNQHVPEAVTNYPMSSDLTELKFSILNLWRLEIQNWSQWAKNHGIGRTAFSFGGSKGKFVFLHFLAFIGYVYAFAYDPLLSSSKPECHSDIDFYTSFFHV
jgi:hypothetical protein